MNIHDYQAKEILRQFGATVPNGVIVSTPYVFCQIKSEN